MTRINANIPPALLSDHHLRAETKEILRIPRYVQDDLIAKNKVDIIIPMTFTLGEGHIKFFVNKAIFIRARFTILRHECTARNIDMPLDYRLGDNMMAHAWYGMPEWIRGWDGSQQKEANRLVVERIIDKMLANLRKRPTYGVSFWGKKETPETTIKRLLKSL